MALRETHHRDYACEQVDEYAVRLARELAELRSEYGLLRNFSGKLRYTLSTEKRLLSEQLQTSLVLLVECRRQVTGQLRREIDEYLSVVAPDLSTGRTNG